MAFCNSMFAPKGKMLKTLLVFGVFGAAVNFPEGYSNSYPNTSINSFRSMINSSYIRRGLENGLSESLFTWVWSLILNIWFIGYLMGTFLTPFITENYGRKMALLVSNAVALIGAVLGFLSVIFQIPEVLFASRLVSALSSGISLGSLILFLQETTATEYRGMTSFFAETTFMLCNVLGIAFGMNALFGRDLLVLTGVAIVPAFMALILTIPLLETPKYLLMKKNDRKAALESLIFYQGDKIENEKILEEMLLEKSKEEKQTPILVSVLHVLKTPHLRTAFVIGCVSLQVVVGIWPIIYLSTDMLSDHFNEDTAQFASLCFILSNFIAGLFGIFTIERFGRRTLFITLGVANTFSLVLYIVFDTLSDQYEFCRWGTVGALVLNGITYGIGLGPIAFFITSELVNQQYRSIVQSMVYAVNTTSNFIFSFATLPIFEHYKSWSFIPLFIIPSIICLIFLFFKMPETKGREIHDIVDEMIRRDSEASEKKHRKKYNISIASDRTTTISEAQKEIV